MPKMESCADSNIRLVTAVITFRNKERNVRSPSYGECVRRAKKCKTYNLGYIIVSKQVSYDGDLSPCQV